MAGALIWHFGEPRTTVTILSFTALMILLGTCEGLVIGYAQWIAVHPFVRALTRREWMQATTLGPSSRGDLA
jgi:hypothetical protein